jgi:hypothetical protein
MHVAHNIFIIPNLCTSYEQYYVTLRGGGRGSGVSVIMTLSVCKLNL